MTKALWQTGWRDRIWTTIQKPWDMVIIGGGITGAGILREATRTGLRALLVDAGDFASGTSSRSSKLVHGGFRYLRDAKFRLMLTSVREREYLLEQGRGLINPLGFLITNLEEDRIPSWVFGAGLILYDLVGLQWGHRRYSAEGLRSFCPHLTSEGLRGGYRYFDAQTDDARLVLRVLLDSVEEGGVALNYARAEDLLFDRSGRVNGVALRDISHPSSDRTVEVPAKVVVNATGAWADSLRNKVGGRSRLRNLRGSHLVFPAEKFPLARAITFLHPEDGRPVFAFPWESVTLYGTTDIDHEHSLSDPPSTSKNEIDYLLHGLSRVFPDLGLKEDDIQATCSGIRGVVDTGKENPSRESREYALWKEKGLLTVTGGKLTTFRVTGHDVMRAARAHFPSKPFFDHRVPVFNQVETQADSLDSIDRGLRTRLLGRYGNRAASLVAGSSPGELEPIGSSPFLWAELRWAARAEGVNHLEDLLLRRIRLGLTLPNGGFELIEKIRKTIQSDLEWDDERWEAEARAYQTLWNRAYRPFGERNI